MSDSICNDIIEKEYLMNGITCYQRSFDGSGDYVFISMTVKAGSLAETESNNGVAHLLEHIQMSFDRRSHSHMFSCRAYTDFFSTSYYFDIPIENLEMISPIIRNILKGNYITKENLEAARTEVLQEIEPYMKTFSEGLMDYRYLLLNSKYLTYLPIGKKNNILKFTLDDIKQFFDNWYHLDQTTLILLANTDLIHSRSIQKFKEEIESVALQTNSKKEKPPLWPLPFQTKLYDWSKTDCKELKLYYVLENSKRRSGYTEFFCNSLITLYLKDLFVSLNARFDAIDIERNLFTKQLSFICVKITGVKYEDTICLAYDIKEALKNIYKLDCDIHSIYEKYSNTSGNGFGINYNHSRQECIDNYVLEEDIIPYDEKYKSIQQSKKPSKNATRFALQRYDTDCIIIIRDHQEPS